MEDQTAFPTRISNQTFFGMTLRDYFAAAALQSLFTVSPKDWNAAYKEEKRYLPMVVGVPLLSYEIADQMMKARKNVAITGESHE